MRSVWGDYTDAFDACVCGPPGQLCGKCSAVKIVSSPSFQPAAPRVCSRNVVQGDRRTREGRFLKEGVDAVAYVWTQRVDQSTIINDGVANRRDFGMHTVLALEHSQPPVRPALIDRLLYSSLVKYVPSKPFLSQIAPRLDNRRQLPEVAHNGGLLSRSSRGEINARHRCHAGFV